MPPHAPRHRSRADDHDPVRGRVRQLGQLRQLAPRVTEPAQASALQCPFYGAPAAEDAGTCGYCHANLAVVGCPSCFAHLFAGMRYCPKCGIEVSREEEGASAFSCPDGHGALTDVRVGILTFGECSGCHGLWIDAEQFAHVIDSQESRATLLRWHEESDRSLVVVAETVIKYRPCPRCTKLMNRVNFARVSKVIIDVCKSHGTWFDRDELARGVTFVQDGGLERSREVEHERAREERRRQAEQTKMVADLKRDAATVEVMSQGRDDEAAARDPISRFLAHFLS